MRQKAYFETERWLDRKGQQIVPEERSNLGGKTKWYGAALLRFSRNEFVADNANQCLPWPIAYDELLPFYEAAEQLLGVRTFPMERDLQRISDKLAASERGWRVDALPLGLSEDIVRHSEEAKHFDAFALPSGRKREAQSALLERVHGNTNLTVVTRKTVSDFIADERDSTRLKGVLCADGTSYLADTIILAAGALHSPRLLQTYLERTGLATRLPCYRHIGRYYKSHALTAVLGFSIKRQCDELRKTAFFVHDACARSSVQPLGWFDGEMFAAIAPPFIPKWLAKTLGQHIYGFFLQTEDGSHSENRVVAHADPMGRPRLDYDLARVPTARAEHGRLVTLFKRHLRQIGFLPVSQPISIVGTAHACGTMVAGLDGSDSVVDRDGRVHGMHNLYVVDGSVLPRSSRVNPALTIYAWSLRVASLLVQQNIGRQHDQEPAQPRHPLWA
jgi:choline dehydrogenase-like flavoprotein